LSKLSHPADFTSNVQCVRLAAGRRTLKKCCYRSRLVFSCCFEDTDILQGSVTTHSRCGRIFSDNIIANFLPILTVAKLRKSVNTWRSYEAYKNV